MGARFGKTILDRSFFSIPFTRPVARGGGLIAVVIERGDKLQVRVISILLQRRAVRSEAVEEPVLDRETAARFTGDRLSGALPVFPVGRRKENTIGAL